MKQDKKEGINFLFRIVMFFTLGCFIGFLFETILCYFQRGYFESRKGFVYGPFNPVYGIGVSIIVYALEGKKKNRSIFVVGALLGGGIEYLCSWVQEYVFGTLSWNYSQYAFNFDGRTSLYHMFWWGLLSFLFIKGVYPITLKVIYKVRERYRLLLTVLIIIFFCSNGLISTYACVRQKQRIDGIVATNRVQKLFDRHFPDSRMNQLFPNRRIASTNQKITKIKNK